VIPAVEVAGARVFLGDCREVLKHLPDNSVDSVVTDPPYELGFMGKKWDSSGVAYDVTVWQECLRVLKPGGHLLAFGGSRTWHRLAVAVEDAGFELRDSIAWLYGSGFPKSHNISIGIDKQAGAMGHRGKAHYAYATGTDFQGRDLAAPQEMPKHEGITPEAKAWEGWGTALKPAFEPVVVGRKPLVGTVAENVLEWGVGGLNIDGSRIGTNGEKIQPFGTPTNSSGGILNGTREQRNPETIANALAKAGSLGRWPANVILDEVTAGLLDEQSGVSVSKSGGKSGTHPGPMDWGKENSDTPRGGHDDSGGASRFFYVAKASKRDRNEGLEELEAVRTGAMAGNLTDGQRKGGDGSDINTPIRQNFHPTVKPTQLMRYLIKLVTPPGGTVLDPFTGSGSTGKAALLDGYQFVGAELTEEYLPIIEGRLRWASEQVEETDDTLF
jgi:site-specific DNA-methyltransferase (adenine-specific)